MLFLFFSTKIHEPFPFFNMISHISSDKLLKCINLFFLYQLFLYQLFHHFCYFTKSFCPAKTHRLRSAFFLFHIIYLSF